MERKRLEMEQRLRGMERKRLGMRQRRPGMRQRRPGMEREAQIPAAIPGYKQEIARILKYLELR